jgi:hypothetical protein
LEEQNNPSGAGYYSLPADSHVVTPGLHYDIRVEKGGYLLTAETRAAGYFHNLTQNHDTIMYGGERDGDYLTFRWTPDSLAFGYFMLVECLNPHWMDDSTLVSGNNGARMMDANFSFLQIPWREDSAQVPWIFLANRGLHRVCMFSCDKAYADYANTLLLGNADNNPVSNVHGGLGLFSVGDIDTAYFDLEKNPNIEHTKW